MAQITTLATTENGKNSRVIINTNFDNLNTEVTTATGDIATLEATVNTGALAGTSGTPSGTNRFVTDDDTSSTPSPNKVVRFTSEGEISGVAPVIEDSTYPAGETLSAGNVVFIENAPTTAQATSAQNIGDVTANTRISFPVFGSGVAGTTLALNLAKTGSPSVALGVRIETDNAGSPSGTLVHANATGTVAAASVGAGTFIIGTATTTVGTIPAFTTTTSAQGVRILTKGILNNIIVNKSSGSGATRAILKSDAGTTLATATFSGNAATINYLLDGQTSYRIELDKSGASYTYALEGGASYPYVGTNLNITSQSIDGTGTDTTNKNNIESITTTGAAEATVTLAGSITIPAGQKCHLVTYQGTYGSETVNGSNYYKVGYSTNDSTTRSGKYWNGSVWSTTGATAEEGNGDTVDGNASTTSADGYVITALKDIQINTVTKQGSCGATRCLITGTGVSQTTTSLVGNVFTFSPPVVLTAGTNYNVLVDKGGASYVYTDEYAPTFPTLSNIKYVQGYGDPAEGHNITSINSTVIKLSFPYTSSTLFQPRVLSKTDADYSYKIDWLGISQEAVTAGELATGKFPKIAVEGIDSSQNNSLPLTRTTMYLGNTPGAISSSPGTNSKKIGRSLTESKIQIYPIPI